MKKINSNLLISMLCLFVVMIGYGVLMPVLPFFIERLMTGVAVRENIAFHFGILTAIYPVALVFTAPFWGRIADRTGPKMPIILGLGGFTLMQVIISFSTTLTMLYVARILGSLFSSFLVPVIIANITAITQKADRTKAMAWAGTAVSAGVVIGPGISGLLTQSDLHLRLQTIHIMFNRFNVPFLTLAILGALTLAVALVFLKNKKQSVVELTSSKGHVLFPPGKWQLFREILLLSLVIQLGITSFESVFPLFIKDGGSFSVAFVGASLLVCGLVMAILQPVVAKWGTVIIPNPEKQIAAGLLIAGLTLPLFVLSESKIALFLLIGIFGLGASLVIPNLLARVSLKDESSSGWAIGMQSSFGGIGQIVGPVTGTALYMLSPSVPFFVTGGLLIATSCVEFYGFSGKSFSVFDHLIKKRKIHLKAKH
ncbi:MFS transporter [Pontibacter sp. E15-1]|uniref:MFS transporter n=1 Tax=Pontibacter sp. E15-1 TaxID=2919918 RepID=UPI001F4F85D9|nr:MFS transporter [Pontibacter sp. E15-1]MCJ8164215.1 MFS transporter [Pontibacter sp. E15-1]